MMAAERRHSHREEKSRSPQGVGPVAVKVEEGTINKPLPDGYSVDREKVKAGFWNLRYHDFM